MVTLFGLLEMNKRSLFSSQFALQMVNHNISNINTPGYSRQDVIFTTNAPTVTPFGILGNGVMVSNIRRATAHFYSIQLRQEQSKLGGWEVAYSALSEMEAILNEPSDTGLTNALNDFYSVWNDLASDPQSAALRVGVVESAKRLANTFQSMDDSLERLHDNVNKQIEDNITMFNSLLSRLAELNGRIVEDEVRETTAGDLRDERDRILLQLSKIAKIDAREDRFGAIDIYMGGINIVHRTEFKSLDTVFETNGGDVKLEIVLKGERNPLTIEDGELVGLLRTRDEYLSEVRESLDHIASVVISKVNEIHRRGWTPQGSGFDFFSGDDAGSIEVALAIRNNTSLVAASYDGEVGDNSLANDIAALSEVIISDSEPFSINELYDSIVSTLGIYTMDADGMVRNGELILSNIEMRKESITGVNLDEELMRLTKYQQSYEAAARVFQIVGELVETIINLPYRM